MQNFDAIWKIYSDSFPKEERRTLEQQINILNKNRYNLNPIYHEDMLVGFYAVWDLDTFLFIEHIAIDRKFRAKGCGSKAIKNIIHKFDKIILEVEKPETYEAKRRIEFYKRLGFHLNNYDYEQPAYDDNKESVPLLIMSYPNKINENEFENVKNKLYKMVYKV
ncbi:GNAT family N-acetyltransferase [Clostridium ganghwense]|uniref:GNAT family N-acetyltransferase n=1 Tax=Clostridium ganghwense TaxID=312089 RepID=A0ABT4CJM6_9CLOT|nr:GNAT family N-acetyltransferase [Clostridium ganghwense]MCY6369259.1 GNAT family N-acetyltransferase [Clostridium ganghwense]